MNDNREAVKEIREIMTRIIAKIIVGTIDVCDSALLINMLEAFEKNPKKCFRGVATTSNSILPPPPNKDKVISLPPTIQKEEEVDSWETLLMADKDKIPNTPESDLTNHPPHKIQVAPSSTQSEKKSEDKKQTAYIIDDPPPQKIIE